MRWTPERTETAIRMAGLGHSARQIAEYLGGVSRSAVIGKLHRTKAGGFGSLPPPEICPHCATNMRICSRWNRKDGSRWLSHKCPQCAHLLHRLAVPVVERPPLPPAQTLAATAARGPVTGQCAHCHRTAQPGRDLCAEHNTLRIEQTRPNTRRGMWNGIGGAA